jgi:hypothetical protein
MYSAVFGTLVSDPGGEVQAFLVDEDLTSRHHWCHWLSNFPVPGKKRKQPQSHGGLTEYAEQAYFFFRRSKP